MSLASVKKVIMRRDNLTSEEADEIIADFRKEFDALIRGEGDYGDTVQLIEDWFGLEPDYLEEFLW